MVRLPRVALLRLAVLAAAVRGLCAGGLKSGALHLKGDAFDPADPETRELLNEALDLDPSVEIAALAENAGLNGGVWVLRDPRGEREERIVKLRARSADGSRSDLFMPEEAEHFANLLEDFTSIDEDPGVVFPTHVLACYGTAGDSAPRLADVIAMRRAPGLTLAILINKLSLAEDGVGAMRELSGVLERVGTYLASFHVRYEGAQHNDMQQSNIIVDRENNHGITFIDLGSMGVPIAASDVRHFNDSMVALAVLYPDFPFWTDGYAAFERAYYAEHARALGLAQAGEDAAVAFSVALPVTVGEDLGLKLTVGERGLLVEAVGDGPVARWNAHSPPGLQVLPGQEVTELNGAVARDGDVGVMVGRSLGYYMVGDRVDVWSSSRSKWYRDGRVLKIDEMGVEVEYNYEGERGLGKVVGYGSYELRLRGRTSRGLLTLSLEREVRGEL